MLYGLKNEEVTIRINEALTITILVQDRNTLCPNVIMRCTLRMHSQYGQFKVLMVCTILQLPLTVHNSVGVLDMTVGIWTRSNFIKCQDIEYSETSIKLTPSGPSQVST